jgi:pimeloyl-ACP methyl ester carboxylesterase
MKNIKTYGSPPFSIALLHGGPGASGEMKYLAENLSHEFGVLELIQTEKSVDSQIQELHHQLTNSADLPAILVGYSWGAWLGYLFSGRYPELVKKLILISSGAFDEAYNADFMSLRRSRLSPEERAETQALMAKINAGNRDDELLARFGELMTIADSYDYMPVANESVHVNMEVYQSVWTEAATLRKTKELLRHGKTITCPVVAIHGDYDPHPAIGVEEPLSKMLDDFKMILLEKCGHTPWKERIAHDKFFEILSKEVRSGKNLH